MRMPFDVLRQAVAVGSSIGVRAGLFGAGQRLACNRSNALDAHRRRLSRILGLPNKGHLGGWCRSVWQADSSFWFYVIFWCQMLHPYAWSPCCNSSRFADGPVFIHLCLPCPAVINLDLQASPDDIPALDRPSPEPKPLLQHESQSSLLTGAVTVPAPLITSLPVSVSARVDVPPPGAEALELLWDSVSATPKILGSVTHTSNMFIRPGILPGLPRPSAIAATVPSNAVASSAAISGSQWAAPDALPVPLNRMSEVALSVLVMTELVQMISGTSRQVRSNLGMRLFLGPCQGLEGSLL